MNGRETYYDGQNPRGRRGWGGRLFSGLVDAVFLLLTLLCSLLLLGAYLAPYIDPNSFWPPALLGLIAPVLYFGELLLLLYWIVRWKRMFVLPFVVLLLGVGKVGLFFRPQWQRDYDDALPAKGALSVMTYNVRGMTGMHDNDTKVRPEEVVDFVRGVSPDVICLQEFTTTRWTPLMRYEEWFSQWPYARYTLMGYSGESRVGLAVYSRYPIVRWGELVYTSDRYNRSMWVDVVLRGDTVRIFNNHLQTTSIDGTDRDYFTRTGFFAESDREARTRGIIRKLRDNYRIRARQADTLARHIAASPYPVIACGDLNDTPLSYVYRTVRGRMRDAFVDKGRGATNTYRGLFNMLRIDYLFHDERLQTERYEVCEVDYSDHNPVVVHLIPKKESGAPPR